jgi:hypothetical protein
MLLKLENCDKIISSSVGTSVSNIWSIKQFNPIIFYLLWRGSREIPGQPNNINWDPSFKSCTLYSAELLTFWYSDLR